MNRAMKNRCVLKTALLVFCAACVIAGICFAGISVKAAVSYTNLFDQTSGVSVSPLADNTGISLTPYQENASVVLFDSTSGAFSMDFTVSGTAKFAVNFKDASGEEIAVYVQASVGEVKAYALARNEKVGIYYYHNSVVGLTASYNVKNEYTAIASGERYTLKFDPTAMKLTVSNGTIEALIWDFSTSANDGYDVGFTLAPFGYYEVKTTFTKPGDYTMNLHKLNGVALGKIVFSFDGPVITVNNDRNMQAGQKFCLPKPFASDFLDGKVEKIYVEAYANGKLVLNKTEYTDGLSIIPSATGRYRLVYSATDSSGNASEYELNVTCSNAAEESVWTLEQPLLNKAFGVGSQLYVPHMTYQSNYQVAQQECIVTVLKDGVVVSGLENVVPGFNLELSQIGAYQLVYRTGSENFTGVYTYDIYVTDFMPVVPALNYPDTTTGETFEFANVQGGAEKKLYYPSGKIASENCVLDEAGHYRVEYSVNGQVFAAQFTVRKPLLSAGNAASAAYGKSPYADEYGLNLMFSGVNTIWLNQVFDLSDNTKADTLIEFYMTPSVKGVQDLDMLELYIKDAYDENNYLTIRINHSAYSYVSYSKVAANGQPLSGWEGHGTSNPKWWSNGSRWGAYSYASLSANAEYRGDPTYYCFKYFFDYEERALYYQMAPGTVMLVADLDDDTCFSTLWEGFTTGEVILGVKGSSYISTGATMFIRNLDGTAISSASVEDTIAPNLNVDMDGYEGNVPQGVVGQSYPVFKAEGSDAGSSVTLSVRVEHVGSKKEYAVTDGKFTPDQAGQYAVIYRAEDGFGCTTEQVVYVTVNTTKPAMSITANPNSSVTVGYKYIIAEPITSGGNGRITWQLECKENGNWAVIPNGYIFTKAGNYEMRYRAVDYIGSEVIKEFVLTAAYSDKPVFADSVQYPAYLVDSDTYTVLRQYAKFYKDGVAGESCNVTLSIVDKYGERIIGEDYFVPYVNNSGDKVTIRYTATYGDSVQVVEYAVPVIKTTYILGTNYSSFMQSGNMTVKHENEYGIGIQVAEGGSAEWIKNVVADGFRLTFNLNSNNGSVGKIVMYLYDSVDASQKIKLAFINDNGVCKLSVNDMPAIAIAGDFSGNTVTVSFDNILLQVCDSDLFKKTVDQTADGDAFQGFTSGKIRFSVEFMDVTGAPKFYVAQLGNQSFRRISGNPDRVEPLASVIGVYDRVVTAGTTIKVLDCVAADILNTQVTVKLSVLRNSEAVTATDGTLLNSVELDNGAAPYYVKLDRYGSYTFIYSVVDGNNNRYQMMKQVTVLMTDDPSIQVDGTLENKYAAGSAISLPGASAQDAAGEETEVIVIYKLPSGSLRSVLPGEKLVLEEKGEYTLRYYTIDQNGNFAEKVFTFVVS